MATNPVGSMQRSGLPAERPAEGESVFHSCPPDQNCPYCNGSMAGRGDAYDWSFLDGAFCISLKSRDDRATKVAAEFHRVGLCTRVVFYRPVKHPKKGIIGSWESHRAVARDAEEHGYERTLILEDDVQFNRHLRPRTLTAVAKALDKLPRDWMIFFLGHWPLWAYFVRPNVLRTTSACAHAYIVSPRLLRWLREHPYGSAGVDKLRLVGKALDSAYAKLPDVYAYFPMIATQSASKSDNWNVRPRKPHKSKKIKHLVTRSRYREVYLARLMRPNEIVVVAGSPVAYVVEKFRRLRRRKSGT